MTITMDIRITSGRFWFVFLFCLAVGMTPVEARIPQVQGQMTIWGVLRDIEEGSADSQSNFSRVEGLNRAV